MDTTEFAYLVMSLLAFGVFMAVVAWASATVSGGAHLPSEGD